VSFQDTLKELMTEARPIAERMANERMSIPRALADPDVAARVARLVKIVGDDSKVDDLMEASAYLSREHEALMAIMASRSLTDDEFRKLGVAGAGAHALSARAFAKASTPSAILRHTVKVIYPYIKLALELGVLLL
jgi:hypothetical protein